MNFIELDLKNGKTALINLQTVAYITENSDYDTTISFVGGKQNLVLNERYDTLVSIIDSRARRSGR